MDRHAYTPTAAPDRGYGLEAGGALPVDSVFSNLERMAKIGERLDSAVIQAREIRNRLSVPPPQPASTQNAKPPPAPMGVVHGAGIVAEHFADRLSELGVLLNEIQQAIG